MYIFIKSGCNGRHSRNLSTVSTNSLSRDLTMNECSDATPKWIRSQCVAGGQCPQDLDVICCRGELRQRYRGANNLASNYKILVRVNYVQDQLTACCFKLSLNFAGGSNQLKGFFGHFSAGYLQLADCSPPSSHVRSLNNFSEFWSFMLHKTKFMCL